MKTVLVLRTCGADMKSYGGFKWKKRGIVTAPDWNKEPVCGGGLHGLLWGEGQSSHLSTEETSVGLVVSVAEKSIVDIDGKVKFPRGEVVFTGTLREAATWLAERVPGHAVHYATVAAGYLGKATAGNLGTATAGTAARRRRGSTARRRRETTAATAGYRGTATAGVRQGDGGRLRHGDGGVPRHGDGGVPRHGDGGEYGRATAGDYGKAMAGDHSKATAGAYGTAMAGDYGTATAGYLGTATAGEYGKATAGDFGILQIRFHDGSRGRIQTGYIGENGLKAGKRYKLDDKHNFIEVP